MNAVGSFFSRYAKAMVPVILGAAADVQRWVSAGHFDRTSAGVLAGAAITALAVSLVANAPAKASSAPVVTTNPDPTQPPVV